MHRLDLSPKLTTEFKSILRSYHCPDFVLGTAFYFYEHFDDQFDSFNSYTDYELLLGCLLLAMKTTYDDAISNKTFCRVVHQPLQTIGLLERYLLNRLRYRLLPQKECVLDCTSRILTSLYQ